MALQTGEIRDGQLAGAPAAAGVGLHRGEGDSRQPSDPTLVLLKRLSPADHLVGNIAVAAPGYERLPVLVQLARAHSPEQFLVFSQGFHGCLFQKYTKVKLTFI